MVPVYLNIFIRVDKKRLNLVVTFSKNTAGVFITIPGVLLTNDLIN